MSTSVTNDSYMDFDSEIGLEYLEEKQETKEKPNANLSKSPLKCNKFVRQPLLKSHSTGNRWRPRKEPVSYNVLHDSPTESVEQECTESTKEIFNLNKSLPSKASTSQKPSSNPVRTRRSTVPAKLYSHEAAKYRAVSHVVPSHTAYRKKKGRKQDPAPAPKQATPYATQRLLSARKLRIDDLRNQIIDLDRKLEESHKEIKIMKEIHDRQQKELQKIEKTRGEIPDMEKSHDEELRIIRAMNRKLQDKIKDLEQKLKNKDESLQRVTDTLQNLKVSLERKKHAESEYERKLKSLNIKLTQKEDTIKALNEKVEILTQDLSEQGRKNEVTKTLCEELQSKLKQDDSPDTSYQCAAKTDVTSSAITLSTADERYQSYLQTPPCRKKEFSILKSPLNMDLIKQKGSPRKQKTHTSSTTRTIESPLAEFRSNHEPKEYKSSPNHKKHHSHLVSSMRREISMFKSGSEKGSTKHMESTSHSSARDRSKIAARNLISSPEKIFSRLQDMCLEDNPHKASTPPGLHEGGFTVFPNDTTQRHNSKGTYIALNYEDLAKKSPPALPKQKK